MRTPIAFRLTGLLATLGVGILLIAWTERHVWRQANELERRFASMQRGGYHLANHLEANILRLNATLLRFDLHDHPADLLRFQQDSQALLEWLTEHQAHAGNLRERELLAQIEAAFRDYLTSAAEVLHESAQTIGAESLDALFERTERESERLLALRVQLADAQLVSLQAALGDSQKALARLKLLLALSLGLVLTVSVVLTVLVYRGLIAPLRVKLVESRVLLGQQEKLAALGLLAAGVAHEIRNPLVAIKARLFTQRRLLPVNSGALEDNCFISDEIVRLDQIIKDFLLFARPAEPHLERIKATAPFRELTGLFQPQLEKNAIELNCEFLADPEIRADLSQLKQVLINLIKNAAESIGQNGRITLRTRTQPDRRAARLPHVAVLEIEDTGQGIGPEVRKRLFDPFFTTKDNGVGLGLSIAVRILEKHGGTLEYQTQAGRGTVFSVVLPIAQHDDPEPG
jgi:signal transduction histidine kinase